MLKIFEKIIEKLEKWQKHVDNDDLANIAAQSEFSGMPSPWYQKRVLIKDQQWIYKRSGTTLIAIES